LLYKLCVDPPHTRPLRSPGVKIQLEDDEGNPYEVEEKLISIQLPNRAYIFQADSEAETVAWETILTKGAAKYQLSVSAEDEEEVEDEKEGASGSEEATGAAEAAMTAGAAEQDTSGSPRPFANWKEPARPGLLVRITKTRSERARSLFCALSAPFVSGSLPLSRVPEWSPIGSNRPGCA
jgi:hypothetical protein